MILLDLDLRRDWGDEVEEMNKNKEGGRYRYPRQPHRAAGLPPRLLPAAVPPAGGPHPTPVSVGAEARGARAIWRAFGVDYEAEKAKQRAIWNEFKDNEKNLGGRGGLTIGPMRPLVTR